jgi:hypothetical protein
MKGMWLRVGERGGRGGVLGRRMRGVGGDGVGFFLGLGVGMVLDGLLGLVFKVGLIGMVRFGLVWFSKYPWI